MGKIVQDVSIDIDDCPTCGCNEYTSTAAQLPHTKRIKCARCGTGYTMQYIPPGASLALGTLERWEKDPFTLIAHSIVAPDDDTNYIGRA